MNPTRYADWPIEARNIAERAEQRHGGWSRFSALRSIRVEVEQLGGPLPWIKLRHRSAAPRSIAVFPHQDRTEFLDYPRTGQRGVCEGTGVRLFAESAPQKPLSHSEQHRQTFSGLRKYRRWDALDTLYFFGCALRTYLSVPFLCSRLKLLQVSSVHDLGQTLHGLSVEFPTHYESHGPRQTFYFDDSGLLRRHDYCAEIVGSWAHGSHYSDDYQESGGIPLAHKRWVVARIGSHPTPIPVLHARFGTITTT